MSGRASDRKKDHGQNDAYSHPLATELFCRCSDLTTKVLTDSVKNKVDGDGILATKLSTHNVDVDAINDDFFRRLPSDSKTYRSVDSPASMKTFLDNCVPVSSALKLKVGAQVMLVKNTKVSEGLANGSRGVVIGFDKNQLPIVKFKKGITTSVECVKWTVKGAGGASITREQLPLKLAWAMSIHKSQGLTLDAVEVSLGKVFECGQAYVALSRASSLQGLRVLDFKASAVRADPQVLEFYKQIRRQQCFI